MRAVVAAKEKIACSGGVTDELPVRPGELQKIRVETCGLYAPEVGFLSDVQADYCILTKVTQ